MMVCVHDATSSAGAHDGVYDSTDMTLVPDGSPRSTTEYAPSEYSAASAEYSHAVANQYAFGHHPNGSIGVGAYVGTQYAIGEDEDDISVVGRGTPGYNQRMGRAAWIGGNGGLALRPFLFFFFSPCNSAFLFISGSFFQWSFPGC
jgi:hypothetical protein